MQDDILYSKFVLLDLNLSLVRPENLELISMVEHYHIYRLNFGRVSSLFSVCGFDFNSFVEMDFIYLNLLTSMNNVCHIVKKVSGIIKE